MEFCFSFFFPPPYIPWGYQEQSSLGKAVNSTRSEKKKKTKTLEFPAISLFFEFTGCISFLSSLLFRRRLLLNSSNLVMKQCECVMDASLNFFTFRREIFFLLF